MAPRKTDIRSEIRRQSEWLRFRRICAAYAEPRNPKPTAVLAINLIFLALSADPPRR